MKKYYPIRDKLNKISIKMDKIISKTQQREEYKKYLYTKSIIAMEILHDIVDDIEDIDLNINGD